MILPSVFKFKKLKRVLRVGLAALACTGPMAANQSIALNSGTVVSFSIPSIAPFTTLGSTRVEMRMHDWVIPSAPATVLAMPGIRVSVLPSGEVCALNTMDPAPEYGGQDCVDASGYNDVTLRVERDIIAKVIRLSVRPTTGGAALEPYCGTIGSGTRANLFPCPLATINQTTWAGSAQVGSPNLSARIAWIKWHSSLLANGSPESSELTSADLGDWRFEGNSLDQSAHGLTMTAGTYLSSGVYAPTCVAGSTQIFRAGFPATLSGVGSYPLNGDSALTYFWQQKSGPSNVKWDNRAAAQPTVRGLVFGTYIFQLTIRDSSNSSTTCTVTHGAVATDANGVVISNNPVLQKLMGPLSRWGVNPWPWFDDRNMAAADMQAASLASAYTTWWRNFQPGTITITGGSATVVGTGTNLKDLCNSGTTPRGGAVLVWRYTGTDGRIHFTQRPVQSCTDNTHITLSVPYPTQPWNTLANCNAGCAGLSYTFGWDGDTGYSVWAYGPAPANYYDNVAGLYSLYYRTGLEKYLVAARNLADAWWEHPSYDQGNSCNTFEANYQLCWPGRSMATLGLVLRAVDGRPDMWLGLRVIWERMRFLLGSYVANIGRLDDVREDAYYLATLSECAIAEPDLTEQQACQSTIANSLTNVWTRYRRPNGGWETPYATIASLNNGGSVAVTNGSTAVVGTGTNFSLSGFFWVFNGDPNVLPTDNAGGDSTYYVATVVDATHLTLDRPYAGPSGSGKGFLLGDNFVGWGAQPFMEGLLGTAFGMAAAAMDGYNNTARDTFYSYNHAVVSWLRAYGVTSDPKGGMYVGTNFPGCTPPIPSTDRMCYRSDYGPVEKRILSAEVMRTLAIDYMRTGDVTLRALGDDLMSQMFSKPGTGGPTSDPDYVWAWDDGRGWFVVGTPPLGQAPKWFGQFFGFPNSSAWVAGRLGGLQPKAPRTLSVGFDLSAVPGAAKVRVTLMNADGTVAELDCSGAPCVLNADGRLGEAHVQLRYLSPSGVVLAIGEPFLAVLQ